MPEPHLALRRQRQWGKEGRAIMDAPQGGSPRPAFVTSENKTEAGKKKRNGKTSLPRSLRRERGIMTEYFLFGKRHFSSMTLRKAPSRGLLVDVQEIPEGKERERMKEGKRSHPARPYCSVGRSAAGVKNQGSKKAVKVTCFGRHKCTLLGAQGGRGGWAGKYGLARPPTPVSSFPPQEAVWNSYLPPVTEQL